MTDPTNQHQEQAREMVERSFGKPGSSPIYQVAGRMIEQLQLQIAAALSSRDTEIRQVLEGLSVVMNYANGAVRCWCFTRDGLHSSACQNAAALYAKLNGSS